MWVGEVRVIDESKFAVYFNNFLFKVIFYCDEKFKKLFAFNYFFIKPSFLGSPVLAIHVNFSRQMRSVVPMVVNQASVICISLPSTRTHSISCWFYGSYGFPIIIRHIVKAIVIDYGLVLLVILNCLLRVYTLVKKIWLLQNQRRTLLLARLPF